MILNAWILIGVGAALLVLVIPFCGKRFSSEIKTEFLSARAAYWCIVAGAVLLILAAIDRCIVDAIAVWK